MNFIRTFHPVGQGAFYTERHVLDNNEEFTIVYDCGSKSMRKRRLNKKIETTIRKDQDIDILFISHFHDDHINGIRFLKDHRNVKLVVMPFVDDDAKVLLLIENKISGGYRFALRNLIGKPDKFFGKSTKIIQIDGISEHDKTETIEISDDDNLSSKTCSSGTKLKIKPANWYYIPFNFNAKTKRDKFFDKLKAQGIPIKEEGNTMDTINKDWDKIKSIYEEVFKKKKLNVSSMVLFSGSEDKNDAITCTCSGHCQAKEIKNSGCLYTGDVNLNEKVDDIKKRLNESYKKIGTLQVPHHGSIHDFDRSVLDGDTIECAVISYGTTNKYGHPSARIIEELRVKKVCDHHVTESPSSMVIQTKK